MELTKPDNFPKFLAEFSGTFILVSTVVFCVYGAVGVFAATAIAMSLMVSVYIFGGISGAHLNPAVSTAIWWTGQLASWELLLCYIGFQLLGGITAAFIGSAVYYGEADKLIEPGRGFDLTQAVVGEFLYTFMLCFTVLNCACTKSAAGNQYFGLAIGFVIIAGGYAWGGISGGAFNPAVLCGFNFASSSMGVSSLWKMGAYVFAEVFGGVAAAAFWKLLRKEEEGGVRNSLSTRFLAEFVGTFFLSFTVCSCVALKLSVTAWCAAASLLCMIYSVGNISGAHLNPAVTAAVLMSGRHKISISDAGAYVGAQLAAGVLAGFLATFIIGSAGTLGPVGGFSWASAFVSEATYTSLLCYTVLSCLVLKPSEWTKDFFGLAIASCVTLGGFSAGAVSGGVLNPAVALAVDTASLYNGTGFCNWLAYLAFEIVGATIATGAFWLTRPEEYAASRKAYDATVKA